MQFISLAYIVIPLDRQRSLIDRAGVLEMRDSILKVGLLHAPVCKQISIDGEIRHELVSGGRRVAALTMLIESKSPFFFDGQLVPEGLLPITDYHTDDELIRFEAELEENLIRVDLPWADRVRALAALHKLRKDMNPTQTQRQTALEIATKTADTNPAKVQILHNEIQRAAALAKHLDNPVIAKARNEKEAYQLILQNDSNQYTAELLRRRNKTATTQLACSVRNGNAIEIMKTMDDGQFDLILTDPPYGVAASSAGFRARTKLHHNYDDSEANARLILQSILTEGWRLTKPKANLFIFTDIKHFQWLQEAASRMAWTPWRFPIIWQKSASEGLVPWGRHGFVHTYDIIFWATKGQRGTNGTQVDVMSYPRVLRSERTYAAEKPIPLLKKLIELTTFPNDVVFDPCAGSGSTLLAAKELNRHSIGIEIDPAVCDLATVRINQGDANADFSILDTQTYFQFDVENPGQIPNESNS